MPSNRPIIQLRLEKQLHEKITALAKEQGRSRSNLVEDIVRRELAKAKR